MTDGSRIELNLTPKPVDGPRSPDAYFAPHAPAPGVRPYRRLGLGTASLGKTYAQPEQAKGIETLHAAWREGFALVDTAPGYGPAELLLSEALAQWRGERPVVATKTAQRTPDLSAVVEQYGRSVERLGEIDLLAVHDARCFFPPEACASIADYVSGLLAEGRIQAAGLGGGGPVVQAQWLEADIFRYLITFNRLGVLSLQALEDTVPLARRHGAAVFAASPVFMGLMGGGKPELLDDPPVHHPPVFIERARTAVRIAEEWSISPSHLAIRFLLSMPAVDAVLSGAASSAEWADVRAAYEAGPLPAELYGQVWQLAQRGAEPMTGG